MLELTLPIVLPALFLISSTNLGEQQNYMRTDPLPCSSSLQLFQENNRATLQLSLPLVISALFLISSTNIGEQQNYSRTETIPCSSSRQLFQENNRTTSELALPLVPPALFLNSQTNIGEHWNNVRNNQCVSDSWIQLRVHSRNTQQILRKCEIYSMVTQATKFMMPFHTVSQKKMVATECFSEKR